MCGVGSSTIVESSSASIPSLIVVGERNGVDSSGDKRRIGGVGDKNDEEDTLCRNGDLI